MEKHHLNPSQQSAVEYTSGPLLIVAGAGTGKTTVITNKIRYLIENNLAKPEEILALTFTDKAAAEMQTRVDEMVDIGYTDLQISTFHSFCQRLLERHAIDIGLSNQFKLLTETSAWLLIKKHFEKFNLDYYRPLGNPYRHIHELQKHFSKCKDELITPEEYLEYAENAKLDNDIDPSASTHNHPSPLLRKEGSIGCPRPDVTSGRQDRGWSEDEKNRLTEVANAYHFYNQLLRDNAVMDFGDLIFYTHQLFSRRKKILQNYQHKFKYILVDEFQDVNWAQYALLQQLVSDDSSSPPQRRGQEERFPRRTPQLTVVGDDDQSIYAFRGASVSNILHFKEDFPNAKEIVLNENYRSQQSILDIAYQSIQNNNPDRLEVKLNIDKKLLSKIDPSAPPLRKGRSTDSESQAVDAPSPTLRRGGGLGGGPVHIHSKSLNEEVESVISEIQRLKKTDKKSSWDDFAILVRANNHADPFINELEHRGLPYEFLASSGLFRQPVVLDCLSFFRAIDDCRDDVSFFRLLCLPELKIKENDLQKITYFAKKKAISYYETLKRGREFDLSEESLATCDKIINLLHDGMRQSRSEKPTAVLYGFMEKSGYLNYLTKEETAGNRTMIRQIYHLKQFFDFLNEFETVTSDHRLSVFLDHFELLAEAGEKGSLYQPSDTPDSINILTVHAAKGLEFKYVFIVNLVEDRFPSRRRGDGIEIPDDLIKERLPEGDSHVEEERRLFYVATTRAKERLYFTSADDYGGERTKKLSRFLAEIGYAAASPRLGGVGVGSSLPSPSQRRGQGEVSDKVQFVFEIPKVFSFSQLKAYDTCPYQYKLAHILKIPTKGSASFSFGQSMHSTMQDFYARIQEMNSIQQISLFAPVAVGSRQNSPLEGGEGDVGVLVTANNQPTSPRAPFEGGINQIKVPTLEELLSIYDKRWQPDWYRTEFQRNDYYKKGKEILKLFYSSHEGNWLIPEKLESWFKIKVGDYFLHGRIDRVDKLPDGTLEIIDYKTGKSKEKLSGEDKEQLFIYQIAVEQIGEYKNLGIPSKLTYYYLNDNLQTSFLGEAKDLEKLQLKLTATMDQINQKNFAPTPSKFSCDYCDFKDICDSRA